LVIILFTYLSYLKKKKREGDLYLLLIHHQPEDVRTRNGISEQQYQYINNFLNSNINISIFF